MYIYIYHMVYIYIYIYIIHIYIYAHLSCGCVLHLSNSLHLSACQADFMPPPSARRPATRLQKGLHVDRVRQASHLLDLRRGSFDESCTSCPLRANGMGFPGRLDHQVNQESPSIVQPQPKRTPMVVRRDGLQKAIAFPCVWAGCFGG